MRLAWLLPAAAIGSVFAAEADLAQVHAVTGDRGRPLRDRDVREVREQPGLADAGVRPEQHQGRVADGGSGLGADGCTDLNECRAGTDT